MFLQRKSLKSLESTGRLLSFDGSNDFANLRKRLTLRQLLGSLVVLSFVSTLPADAAVSPDSMSDAAQTLNENKNKNKNKNLLQEQEI